MAKTKDCNCYNGFILSPDKKKKLPCPNCAGKRKEELRDGVRDEVGKRVSLAETLKIGKRYVTDTYNDEEIIGKADIYYLDKRSLTEFNSYVGDLVGSLTVGRKPDTSLMMYLGRHAKLQEFAYVLLSSAYVGNLSVGSLLTPREIKLNKYDEDFKEHYTNDIEVVILTNDMSQDSLDALQGFMQERAYKDKPTIILLSARRSFKYILTRFCSIDSPRYDLAAYIGVDYKHPIDVEDMSIKVSRKVFQVSNDSLGTTQELSKEFTTKQEDMPNNSGSNTPNQVNTQSSSDREISKEFDFGGMSNPSNFGGRA